MTHKLAAIILTRDEAHNVVACIESLRAFCDPVVVWDSGSRDETAALAQGAGALVHVRPFDNYAAQRQAATYGSPANSGEPRQPPSHR